MKTPLLINTYRNPMERLPTFREFFDNLVAQKKKEINKASDEDAFYAAVAVVIKLGFRPDFEFQAYKKRKVLQKKEKK